MRLSVILTRPPYGDVQAAEAVRHALGAIGEDMEVRLILCDAGVMVAKKGQSEGDTGYTNLGESLKDVIEMGGDVIADRGSVREFGLEPEDVIEGVRIVNGYELSEAVKESDRTMIF